MRIDYLGDSDPGLGSPVVDTDGVFLAYGVSSSPGTVHVLYMKNLHAPLLELHSDLLQRPVSAVCLCHASIGSSDQDSSGPQSLLCAASSDAVVIWSLPSAYDAAADGRPLPQPILLLEGAGPVDAIIASDQKEAARRLVVCAGTEAFVFDLTRLRNTHRLQGHQAPLISAAFLAPHSPHILVTCGEDRRFTIWDLDQSTMLYQSSVLTAYPLISLAVDPTFPRIAVGAADGVLRFFDLSSLPACRLIQTVDVARKLQKIAEKAERIAQTIRSSEADGPVVVTAASSGGDKRAAQGYMAVSELALNDDTGGDDEDGSVAVSGAAILCLLYTSSGPSNRDPSPLPSLLGPHGMKTKLIIGTTRAVVLLDAASFEIDEAHYLRGGIGGSAALAQYHRRADKTPSALKAALEEQLSQFDFIPEASKAGGMALSPSPNSDGISLCIACAFEPQMSIFSLTLGDGGEVEEEEEDPLAVVGDNDDEPGGQEEEASVVGGITVFLTKPLPSDSPLQLASDPRASTSGSASSSRRPSPSPSPSLHRTSSSGSTGSSSSSKKPGIVNKPVTFHQKVKSSGYGFVQPTVKMGSAPPPKVKVTKAVATSQMGRHLLAQRQYPSDCGLLVELRPSLPGAFHASAVLSLSYSSDASRLLSSSADKTARAMKLPLSKHNGDGTDFIGHNSAVVHSSWSHDGTMCLTSSDRTVKMSSGYGVYAEANKRQGYGLDAEVPNGLKAGGELVPQQLDSKGVHDQNYGVNADANRLAGNQTPSRVAPEQFDRLADVLTAGHGVPPPPPPPPPPPGMTYAPPRAGPPQIRNPASTPVIDINKLPRYGVLAPPIERPERVAGKYVDYDRATQVFVKNRGAMREALESKTGYYENAPMRMWSQFALKQKQRYVPIPPDANRRVLPETQGYRLRVLKISDLPLHTTFDGRTFEFQLGVSLYDEAYGTFYGNTVYSMSDAYDRNRAAQRNAIDLDFSFDVYYHTAVSDPRCMAVVEIIMVERMLDGVVKGEYSLGWALLPLFRVAGEVETGRPLSVPLVSGTPRYLLFRNLYNEDLRPPKVIPNCSIMFQAEAYPAMDAYIPLLPQDFLVSYSDVVPGLRRFDTAGQLSITAKTVISTLAAPMLSPTYSIVLRRLQLALPAKLHELLLSLDPKRPQSFTPPPIAYGQEPSMIGLTYTLRVSVHNSRTFVGPSYELTNISHLDVPGWKVLQVPAPDAVFDYVMGDVLTAIVVELLATPPQVYQPDVLPPVQYSLGWSAFVPFSFISDDGAQSEVAVGVHRYPLVGESGLLLRDQPPLDWRSLLGDSMTKEIPDPLVEFQLFETGRTPIPPPLNRNFTIIERQREEEAAMGEQPLEQVLAPVQVPPEIAPPAGPLIVSDQYVQDVFSAQPQVAPPPLPLGPSVQEQVPPILMARHEALYGPSSDKDRDQLRDLADAMQKQLALLTRAVDELKDERKSLRSSVLALADGSRAQPQSQTVQPDVFKTTRQNLVRNTAPDDIQRLMDLPPTSDLGDNGAFSGGPPPSGSGSVPSRMMMQQLYDSGMLEGLPDDVQAMLRRRGMQKGPLSSPIDLSIEARDPRMASDVVFQFLAYRHHDTLNAPVNVQSLYFTFQFYHFAPTTSTMSYLVQPNPGMQPAKDLTLDGGGGAMASDPTTVNATRLLVTNHPNRKGAGVTVKYVVDASNNPVPSGQTPDQAAFEGSMHFAQFLAAKSLNVDVWDGESLLQVGTATLNLQSLLRQGRDFAELLVEVPIIDQSGALPESALLLGQSTLPSQASGNDATTPTILSKGSLVVRVINIGREPRNLNGQLSQRAFDGAKGGPGKKVRVRVKPAWAVKGPISRELANGEPNPLINPIAESYQGEQFLSDMSGGRMGMKPTGVMGSPPRLPFGTSSLNLQAAEAAQGKGQPESEEVKMHILEREHHKSTRLNVMKEALDDHPLIGGGLVPGREDQFRQVQKQLLADVTSVRTRNKEQVIKDSLRKNMVISKVIRPGYGEVVVYEHEFVNPYSQEMVFEVKVSEPREVSVLTRMDEYRALRAANARFFGNPSQPVSHLEQEVMSGNRIYLQAHERITLPFKLQSFEPPEGYGGPKGGVVQAPSDGSLAADAKRTRAEEESPSGHTVTVELVSVSHEHPVMVLELQVVPRPLVIDRTFRFYQPEHSLMRQTVKMKNLPGTETTFAGGALRSLAVACSHPDIIVGAGSSGLTGGSEERDEVYIKYKCGGAPEVTHFYVLLYQDRLLARPVEIWQVFAHCLRKVDMRAVIGQTSQASVVVRGAHSTRRVACYSSHPDELQVNPGSFVLVSGALTELLLSFRPVTQGLRDIKVNLVDTETRELVYALIITAEAQGPLVTRTFEVELPAGTVAQKKIQYTNPYQTFRTFTLRSNQPWLVHFTPQRLQLPPGATRPLGLTFDGRAATTGILDVLIFVNDEEDKTEECFKVRCRIYR